MHGHRALHSAHSLRHRGHLPRVHRQWPSLLPANRCASMRKITSKTKQMQTTLHQFAFHHQALSQEPWGFHRYWRCLPQVSDQEWGRLGLPLPFPLLLPFPLPFPATRKQAHAAQHIGAQETHRQHRAHLAASQPDLLFAWQPALHCVHRKLHGPLSASLGRTSSMHCRRQSQDRLPCGTASQTHNKWATSGRCNAPRFARSAHSFLATSS